MPVTSYMLQLAVKGVDQSVDSSMLTYNQVSDAVNVQIKDAKLTCRPGVRVHKLGINGNFQGACFYNPARGISQKQFANDRSSIVARIAGRHYNITPGASTGDAPSVVRLGNDDTDANSVYHLAYMKQCENYVIAQDGNGATWIWDGESTPFLSSGYNTSDKEDSRLANGASVLGYSHGRVIQVVNGRQVLVGDIIHKTDFTTASNILETTEQTYWATGSFFSPPSELGPIRAVEILPLRDTAHGHGDTMFHTDEGIFSLDLTIYPRESWANEAIARHVLLDTGASGYYALALYDGDQIFLSRHGVQTLRSARAESSLLGNPFHPISEPVREYVENDYRPHFRFANVEKFVEQRRLFVTTSHVIRGSEHRGARGLLVMNFQPIAGGERAWEGLWTLPSECGIINHLESGVFDGEERFFAFTTDDDGEVYMVEFTHDQHNDILSDGTEQPIRWQILTREDAVGESAEVKTIERAQMSLRDVRGCLKWDVLARSDLENWQKYHSGCAEGQQVCLEETPVRDLLVKFGSPPQDIKTGTRFQLLIQLEGCGAIESIKTSTSFDTATNARPTPEGECVVLRQENPTDTTYDPFEYHNG